VTRGVGIGLLVLALGCAGDPAASGDAMEQLQAAGAEGRIAFCFCPEIRGHDTMEACVEENLRVTMPSEAELACQREAYARHEAAAEPWARCAVDVRLRYNDCQYANTECTHDHASGCSDLLRDTGCPEAPEPFATELADCRGL